MRLPLILLIVFFISACTPTPVVVSMPPQQDLSKKIEAVGYGTISQFKNYPKAQQRLLAMRAARLDAYRNIVEEFYGTRIKGQTTVRDMVIENDSYRSYFDAVVKGIHLITITPKGDDIYEAEVELTISNTMGHCLSNLTSSCLRYNTRVPVINNVPCNANFRNCSQQTSIVTTQPLMLAPESELHCQPDCQGLAYPQVIYYAD